MAKPRDWKNITLPPEVMERLKGVPGVSGRKKIEWLLDAVEQNSLTKVTYDELTEYVVNQSKSQKKEKVFGLIVGLLRCLL